MSQPAKQIIANLRAALTPGAAQHEASATAWLQVPAVVQAVNDTREMSLNTAAQQIAFMTGHQIAIPLVELLRLRVPAMRTATVTSSKLSMGDGDDEKMRGLWTQSHERAHRMHAVWEHCAQVVEDRIQSGMNPSEKHMRLLALLNDSAGGAARTAASMFEVAASRNEMSVTGPVSGRAPIGLENGRVVLDLAAIPTESTADESKIARWTPD